MRFFQVAFLSMLLFPCASFGQESLLERSRGIYASGDVEEAIRVVNSYISEHPDDFLGYQYKGIYVRNLAWNANDRKLYDEAVALFKESLKRTDDKEQKAINWGNIGSTYFQMKQYSKAEPYYELCLKQSGRVYYSVLLGQCQVKRGRIKAGLKTVSSLTLETVRQGDGPTNEGLTAYNMGLLYAYANRPKEAVYWLRLSVAQNGERFTRLIKEDEDLDPIRETKEFQDFHRQFN